MRLDSSRVYTTQLVAHGNVLSRQPRIYLVDNWNPIKPQRVFAEHDCRPLSTSAWLTRVGFRQQALMDTIQSGARKCVSFNTNLCLVDPLWEVEQTNQQDEPTRSGGNVLLLPIPDLVIKQNLSACDSLEDLGRRLRKNLEHDSEIEPKPKTRVETLDDASPKTHALSPKRKPTRKLLPKQK